MESCSRTLLNALPTLVGCFVVTIAGCHDGPLYALKYTNPWYTMHEWAEDEKLGITDVQRTQELKALISQIGWMSEEEQRKWMGEMGKLIEHDQSPHMRALALRAAIAASVPESLDVIAKGIEDTDPKVRIVGVRGLETRSDPRATQLLIKSLNSEANKDVRLAAILSLGNHRGPEVLEALKSTVREPDLAYQHASVISLKEVTGKDAGNDPEAWVALVDSLPQESSATEVRSASWRERLLGIF